MKVSVVLPISFTAQTAVAGTGHRVESGGAGQDRGAVHVAWLIDSIRATGGSAG